MYNVVKYPIFETTFLTIASNKYILKIITKMDGVNSIEFNY